MAWDFDLFYRLLAMAMMTAEIEKENKLVTLKVPK